MTAIAKGALETNARATRVLSRVAEKSPEKFVHVTAAEARVMLSAADKKKLKFGNRHTKVDGHTFDSKAEAWRYGELTMLVRAKKIRDLAVHPKYALRLLFTSDAGEDVDDTVGTYEADFSYVEFGAYPEFDKHVVEDVKGVATEVYKLKRALFRSLYRTVIFRELKV